MPWGKKQAIYKLVTDLHQTRPYRQFSCHLRQHCSSYQYVLTSCLGDGYGTWTNSTGATIQLDKQSPLVQAVITSTIKT